MSALGASGYVLVGRALRASGRVLAVLCLARMFSPDAVADFAFAFVIATIAGMVSDLGLGEFAVREIAGETRSTSTMERRIVTLRLATLVPALGVAWVTAVACGVGPIAAFGSSSFALALIATDLFASIRRGHSRHDIEALECGLPLSAVGIAAISAFSGSSLSQFHLVLGGAALAIVAVRGLSFMSGGKATDDHAASLTEIVRGSGWLLARTLVTWLLFDGMVLLLREFASSTQLALYAVAARPIGLMMQALSVFPMVFYPALSRTQTSEPDRLRERTNQLNLIHIAAIPAVFAACTLAGDLLLHLSGDLYVGGQRVLQLLSIGTLVYAGTISTIPIIVLRRERLVAAAAAAGVVTLVVLGAILIPDRGAWGAALAAFGAYVVCKVLHIVAYRALGIALGDRRHPIALAIVAGFLTAAVLLHGAPQYAVLVAGGIASVAFSLRLLSATRLTS